MTTRAFAPTGFQLRDESGRRVSGVVIRRRSERAAKRIGAEKRAPTPAIGMPPHAAARKIARRVRADDHGRCRARRGSERYGTGLASIRTRQADLRKSLQVRIMTVITNVP
jgi:hypothetical protein